jgi:kynurenine formamidase
VTDTDLVRSAFDELFERNKNWGRWGPDDELGRLNLIDAECVRRALTRVAAGLRVSCGRSLRVGPSAPGTEYVHHMLTTGVEAAEDGFASTADWFGIGCHGTRVSHIDSPAHIVWNSMLYNGFPANSVSARQGALHGSVDAARDGIVTSAHLVDLPLLFGVDEVAGGTAVGAHAFEEWFATRERPAAGDAVLVRFGRDIAEQRDRQVASSGNVPGLAVDCIDWFREHDISVLVTDFIADVQPHVHAAVPMPIHTAGIAGLGMWLVDNANLGELSRVCAVDGRGYSGALIVAPLILHRSTGSPVNPIVML